MSAAGGGWPADSPAPRGLARWPDQSRMNCCEPSTNLRLLSVDLSHVVAVERLSFHHQDPFDRLLVAQALTERLPIVTRDREIRKYGVEVVW